METNTQASSTQTATTLAKGSVCVAEGSVYIILEASPALEVLHADSTARWKIVNHLPDGIAEKTKARIALFGSNGSHGYLVQCPGGLIVCPHERPVYFCANEDLIAINHLLRDKPDGSSDPS